MGDGFFLAFGNHMSRWQYLTGLCEIHLTFLASCCHFVIWLFVTQLAALSLPATSTADRSFYFCGNNYTRWVLDFVSAKPPALVKGNDSNVSHVSTCDSRALIASWIQRDSLTRSCCCKKQAQLYLLFFAKISKARSLGRNWRLFLERSRALASNFTYNICLAGASVCDDEFVMSLGWEDLYIWAIHPKISQPLQARHKYVLEVYMCFWCEV